MTRRRLRARLTALLVAALVAILGGAFFLGSRPEPAPTPPAAVTPTPTVEPAPIATTAPGSVAELAASLPLIDPPASTESPSTTPTPTPTPPPYLRADFGPRWADIDGNGCDQRQDVLTRDLTEITRDRCTVLTGILQDPYTGASITFQHDRVAVPGNDGSEGVQIDHIVSLSAAHAGGAWRWTPEERETFANTLSNLLAVDGRTNGSKNDRGPAEWMPPDSAFVCDYAQRYTEIAAQWHLAVLSADRDALTATLTSCVR